MKRLDPPVSLELADKAFDAVLVVTDEVRIVRERDSRIGAPE